MTFDPIEKQLDLSTVFVQSSNDLIWLQTMPLPLPVRVTLAFRLDADAWQGQRRVRFLIEAAQI